MSVSTIQYGKVSLAAFAVCTLAFEPLSAARPRSLVDETGIKGCTVHTNRFGTVLYDFIYDKPDLTPIVFGAWSRADRVDGGDYCMYADVWYSDGSVKWSVRADFRFMVQYDQGQ